MREIDQIRGLRAKRPIDLVGNPRGAVAHAMDAGLVADAGRYGARPELIAGGLHAAHRRAKARRHRAGLPDQTQAGFCPRELPGLSAIRRPVASRCRGRVHLRQHAPIHLRNQPRDARVAGHGLPWGWAATMAAPCCSVTARTRLTGTSMP
jgi:hypothetical protein